MAQDIILEDGHSLAVDSGAIFYLVCCDCDLTHAIKVRVVSKEARLEFSRDQRRTSQRRRRAREKNLRKFLTTPQS